MAADEDACSAADGGSCAPSVEDASAAEASTQQLEAMLDNGASAEELDAVLGEGTVLKPAPESATESAPTPPTAEELAAQAVALRKAVSVLLCTVIFYANLAHSLTRSP